MERLLPASSKWGFGVGQVAEGIKVAVFNTFVLFYYNQILGVPATQTALALGIATIFDAVTDPVAGYLSDKTRSRFGRRHPWIMASAVPLGASLIMLFAPPAGMSSLFYMIWLLVSAVGLHLFLTLYHIPHLALGAEMAKDYHDRTSIYTYSTFLGALGGWGFYFMAMSVIFPSTPVYSHGLYNPHGYLALSLSAGVLAVISIAICVWGTWKEIPYLHKIFVPELHTHRSLSGLVKEMFSLFSNPSFRALFGGSLIFAVLIGVKQTLNIYLGVHFWELPSEKLRWLAVMVLAGLPFSFLLAPKLTRLWDKKKTLLIILFFATINDGLLISLRLFTNLLPSNNDPLLFYLILAGFFIGGAFGPIIGISILSMLADVADEQELLIGRRQEGAIFSLRSFTFKLAGALGGVLGGVTLDLISFPTGAKAGSVSGDVLFRLGLVDGPIYAGAAFATILLFFGYRLNRSKVEKIQSDLKKPPDQTVKKSQVF